MYTHLFSPFSSTLQNACECIQIQYIRIHILICIHTQIHIYVCMYMYIDTYRHINTYIHIYISPADSILDVEELKDSNEELF
jgi:hypothetical protein